MYRVLKLRNWSYSSYQAFNPHLSSLHGNDSRCILCNTIGRHLIVGGNVFECITALYSTRISTSLSDKHLSRRKRNWKRNKYIELLEVSSNKTSEKKTKVKTVNARSWAKFQEFEDIVDQPEIKGSLDVLEHDFDGKPAPTEVVEELEPEDCLAEFSEDKIEPKEKSNSCDYKNLSKKNKEKLTRTSVPELDDSGKEKSFNSSLVSYVELCMNCGFLNRGWYTVLYYLKNKKALVIKDERVFTILMECCAKNGNIEKLLEIWKTMVETAKIEPSAVSYARRFESIARSTKKDKAHMINSTIRLMRDQGISCNDIFERTEWKQDSREVVLSAIRAVQPQFTPEMKLADTEYKCAIVNHLNKKPYISLYTPKHPTPGYLNCTNGLYNVPYRGDRERKLAYLGLAPLPTMFLSLLIVVTSISLLDTTFKFCNVKKEIVSPAQSMFEPCEINDLFKKQLELEKRAFVKINSIEKITEVTEQTQFCRKALEELEKDWEKAIAAAFHKDLVNLCSLQHKLHRSHCPINIYPYLTVLDKSDYVEIIKQEVLKLATGSESYSPTVSFLCRDLGNMVKIRYDIKTRSSNGVLEKLEKVYGSYSKWYLNPEKHSYGYNPRHTWQLLKQEHLKGPTLDIDTEPWPITTLTAVGKFLYNIILRDIKIDVNILKQNNKKKHYLPAFYTLFRYQMNSSKEEVKPHPVLSRLFKTASWPHLFFSVTDLPMLSPPLPWSTSASGGYLVARSPLIRLPHSAVLQRERLREGLPNQIYPCLDSLNQLGSIPWKVNKLLLDTVLNLFNTGGHEKLGVPSPPPAIPQLELSTMCTKEEKYEAFRSRILFKRKRAEMYSLWCDALYRLSLANHFRDRIFWLPHNMDFRGRVYPCPPHLNHLGSDLYRALLVFAQSRPLGPNGLDWLKIHAINLTGLKKRDSVHDRLEYANSILPSILESADKPFEKGSWWMESEKPWQTLATCFEIRDALCYDGGHEAYPSCFPVHQDGSCNGLQHYAALGRDASGAESVNLAPSDVPQDVYSCVAAIVDRERAIDAAKGVEIAKVLEGFVKRKVIKQTVMTTVYGVTRFGARLQIAKQLKDLEDFPKEHVWQGSQYLVHKTFDSIREMFTSTREIQDWFTESARLIAGIRGENLEYITPLGLPVVQPYSKNFTRASPSMVKTTGVVSHDFKYDKFERPNVVKQKNAFPPNFIHSLDSSHMMLTSLNCQREGITFVSVHDCYWTHPDTVHIMNKICREQFVSLHSQPILQELSEFLMSRYGFNERIDPELNSEAVVKAMKKLNTVLKNIPPTGNFELKKVLDSVYFFS